MIFLLCVALIISVVSYVISKRVLVAVFVMSLLGNIILSVGIDYNFSKIYNVTWLFEFTKNIFPYINIALLILLIINFIKIRHEKAKN